MKILIYTLALISAFFVSNSYASIPDSYDPVPVPAETKYQSSFDCVTNNYVVGSSTSGLLTEPPHSACIAPVTDYAKSQIQTDNNFCSFFADIVNEDTRYITIQWNKKNWGSCDSPIVVGPKYQYGARAVGEPEEISYCPPENNPTYTIPVTDSTGKKLCYRLKSDIPPEPEPDNSCDEFGDNSFLPPKTGLDVPTGGSVCYTTSTGKQCKYSKNDFGDGYTQTGQQCSGEEPPYGEPQTPDGDCAVVGSLEFFAVCPVDPNEACNPLLVNNETVYQCPTGCGSVNGEYVCVYEDKNANGIPDKDENPDNPDPDNPDPDNPDPENPDPTDMTQTNNLINGLGGKLDGMGSTLDGIKSGVSDSNELLGGLNTKLSDISLKQDATNQILGNINNSSSLIAGNTDAIAGNTKGILEALEPSKIPSTFNPDASSSFYESSYENGFEGVWEEKSTAFKQTETVKFIEQFKFDSGGEAPETQICFDLGRKMDFGCDDLPIASPQLLSIIKIFILITAAFLCRALIFGG
ncbi:hypothetical protein [Pseudoalteromonas sp. ASV78]|uniref:hypothetical protein n=1 Tax=Pseudoalteromonas sp. ASV78 TaxID=3397851 RepID=UPI0039FD76F8